MFALCFTGESFPECRHDVQHIQGYSLTDIVSLTVSPWSFPEVMDDATRGKEDGLRIS